MDAQGRAEDGAARDGDMSGFLDTSVLIRYITGAPPDMSQHAVEIVESSDNLVITEGVIGETAFVLSSVYRMPREEIVDWLMDLTGRSNVAVYAIDKDLALQGLRMCRPSGRVSIADAMIWAAARSAGANHLHIRPVVSW